MPLVKDSCLRTERICSIDIFISCLDCKVFWDLESPVVATVRTDCFPHAEREVAKGVLSPPNLAKASRFIFESAGSQEGCATLPITIGLGDSHVMLQVSRLQCSNRQPSIIQLLNQWRRTGRHIDKRQVVRSLLCERLVLYGMSAVKNAILASSSPCPFQQGCSLSPEHVHNA